MYCYQVAYTDRKYACLQKARTINCHFSIQSQIVVICYCVVWICLFGILLFCGVDRGIAIEDGFLGWSLGRCWQVVMAGEEVLGSIFFSLGLWLWGRILGGGPCRGLAHRFRPVIAHFSRNLIIPTSIIKLYFYYYNSSIYFWSQHLPSPSFPLYLPKTFQSSPFWILFPKTEQ